LNGAPHGSAGSERPLLEDSRQRDNSGTTFKRKRAATPAAASIRRSPTGVSFSDHDREGERSGSARIRPRTPGRLLSPTGRGSVSDAGASASSDLSSSLRTLWKRGRAAATFSKISCLASSIDRKPAPNSPEH